MTSPTYAIRVKHPDDQDYIDFEKNLNETDFSVLTENCLNNRRIGLFEATLIPVRTHNWKDLGQDLLLPTFFNHALHIHDIAVQSIMIFTAFFLDILTLPIRVCTLIPRYLFNKIYPKESDIFYQHLVSKNVSEKLLQSDAIDVEYEKIEGKNSHKEWETYDFIQLPENATAIMQGLQKQKSLDNSLLPL